MVLHLSVKDVTSNIKNGKNSIYDFIMETAAHSFHICSIRNYLLDLIEHLNDQGN